MAVKLFVLAAALAVANAGLLTGPAYAPSPYASTAYHGPALTSTSANILRSPGNLGQVSTYSKTIDTPYSSVSKSDVRVSNPGYATYASPAYHAPTVVATSAYPSAYATPVVKTAPVAYASPAYHAPAAYASPAYHAPATYAAPAVAHGGLLGVAYSAAPAVSHMSFDGYGINYVY